MLILETRTGTRPSVFSAWWKLEDERKEKELCSSDSLLFRMNAFGTRLFVNSVFILLTGIVVSKTVGGHLSSRYE